MTTKKLTYLLSSPFLLLLLTLIHPVKVYGQLVSIPDCVVFVSSNVTAGSGTTVSIPVAPYFNNRTAACQSWTFQYQVSVTTGSFTGISVQSAGGEAVAGSFTDWTGTVSSGINPNTNQSGAVVNLTTGCIASTPCTVPNSFIRILLTRNTFVGAINGVLYGYKTGYPGGGGSGGGGSGCTTPCPVVGTAAVGQPPSGAPVQVGFFDGTDMQTQFACTNQAAITITAGTDVVLVSGVASTAIRVCHIDWASDTQATFTIRQGTGTVCGTNTLTLAGAYPLIVNFFANYEPASALRTTIAARDLCLHASTASTVGGVVIYSQY